MAQTSSAERSRPRPYRRMAVAGSLALAAAMGVGYSCGSIQIKQPKSAFAIEVFQGDVVPDGVVYNIEETRLLQTAPGEFTPSRQHIGHFACGRQGFNTTIHFDPLAVSALKAEAVNASVGQICTPYGAATADAAQRIAASVAAAQITG